LVVFGAARTETPLPNVRRVKQAIFNMEKSVVLLDDPHIYDDLEELLILFQCYRRWKGRLTHLRLSQMEKRFIATGQGARFDAFFDVIKQLLAPECITPHGYIKTFSSMTGVDVFGGLASQLSPILDIGDPVILYSGTLLGHVREDGPIGHDDDVDVAVFLGEHRYEVIPNRWYAYKKALFENGLISEKSASIKTPVIKVDTDIGMTIDLFPAWSSEGRFSVYPYSLGELTNGMILPLQGFRTTRIMLPSDSEAFLEHCYGETWRVPDPLFHFDWENAYHKFELLVGHDFSV
jgi:hypothetical protein